MLELKDVCFTIKKEGEPLNLLDKISIKVPAGHFMAIVGPSGCGKTTLLKTIAGLNEESEGDLYWNGKHLVHEADFEPSEIGYVPQFSIAYDQLTVDESIESATQLRVKTSSAAELDHRIDSVLLETGLDQLADRQVKVLSGGQKRRLGLAMELVSGPRMLLCDEVTSGLDPRSERDIVRLLHQLSRTDGRSVISVTHSLAHLELYDSILVLHEGKVAYHGPPQGLNHYFSVDDTEEIYPKLAKQPSDKWQSSWLKHRQAFYQKLETRREKLIDDGVLKVPAHADVGSLTNDTITSKRDETKTKKQKPVSRSMAETGPLSDPDEETSTDTGIISEAPEAVETPSIFKQFSVLLNRRWKIFFRDRGQVILQVAILLGFPILVSLFNERGNVNVVHLSDSFQGSMADIQEKSRVFLSDLKIGSAISGIIMFQVVLLALMGSNNSAREIAGERLIFEKEKFGGVRPLAYLASKITFIGTLVLIQSIWMAVFVQQFWPFPEGPHAGFLDHILFLILINAAMSSICLGISALMRTSEQSSLLSIYLVGFQLPLSGAVLALPDKLAEITRPFIASYWSWSGSIESLGPSHKNAVKAVIETDLNPVLTCQYVLAIHIIIGIVAAYIGIKRHSWD
ncbi:ATP-binding cassette domain-containing protein [Persicirhabdus sediminis]|uniref:ATP-binding cassette domain-containing protein n=1 Tax=Persicirhabdus sediminis TaxID=454144 RepID=A0A8J7MGT8_9BACT|nr:ATP-binding cassette domain-containing protein [Persicirhabdus sediminis]MBK1792647.1 ATP-binding cassette domain-containing protein [Persicirhabdus sediminis]